MNAVLSSPIHHHEAAMGRSASLSALVHLVLLAVMFVGVRWQSHRPDVVEVELWEAPSPAAALAPPTPPAPPRVEPAPRIEKPVIAEREKPKPKAKPEPKKVEAKPKPDPQLDKRLREQALAEQKVLEDLRREQALRELLARSQVDARGKALNEYIGRIQAAIRQRIRESELAGIVGNPAADFDVVQIPSGDVISIKMRKSSGYPRYDAEVERAIMAASPLPRPPSPDLFSRELKLTFRPLDK